jgi:hypothetical protein
MRLKPVSDRLKNVLLLSFTILVCLYIAEFLHGFYLTKSILHFPLPPNSEQQHITADYSVSYRYNNYSLRGRDYTPLSTYDAVFLGDSFFFGQGVKEGKTFTDLLQNQGFHVLNASEIATNPIDYFHKLRILQSHHLKAKRIVIELCMGNDFQDIGDKKIAGALNYTYRPEFLRYDGINFLKLERLRYQIRKKWFQFNDWIDHLGSESPYIETVVAHDFEIQKKFYADWIQFFADNRKNIMKSMAGYDQKRFTDIHMTEDAYLQMIQINNDSLDNTLKILNAVNEFAKPTPVYVMLIPSPYYAFGFRSDKYDDFLHRLIRGLNPSITVIDLHGLTTGEMHYPHDGHWNEKGHQFIADIFARGVLTHP